MKPYFSIQVFVIALVIVTLSGCTTSYQKSDYKDLAALQKELEEKELEQKELGTKQGQEILVERPEQTAWDLYRLCSNTEASAKGWSVASPGRGQTYIQSFPFNRLKTEGEHYLGAVQLFENGSENPSVVFMDTNAVNMGYGSSTAISTDKTLVVIGAPGMGSENPAYLYAYLKSPTGWDAVTEGGYPTLFGMPGKEGSKLGAHVAVSGYSGETVLAGAPGENGHGRAFYFIMPPEGWNALTNDNFITGYLGVGNPSPGDEFGRSVAISKDDSRIVVGAPGRNGNRGGVYVFDKPADGWTNIKTLFPIELPSGVMGERFGQSVAISADGKVIAVGAPGADGGNGRSYVITNMDTAGGSYDCYPLENIPGYKNLGISIDISSDGKRIASGGFGQENSGFFGVHGSNTTDWLEPTLIFTTEGRLENAEERGSMFGFDLDLSDDGSSLLVGAPLYNNGMGVTSWYDIGKP